jgi:cyclomaltodextrinase / maltogenic alpha-amylase / neopullulanase
MSGGRQWADTAIWWHVYPLGFVGADTTANPRGEVAHELPRLTAWLDDLLDLGCNGLLLGPIFDSESHGYDTVDHLRIDPRLGDDADADALFAACRERGIRVLLDGVFNHVGRTHPWWREAVEAGPGSPAAARFATGPGARTLDGLPVQVFEGHESLVVLDHDNPEVASAVSEVMAHWLRRGVDGWRLDAAYAVPAAFWRSTIGPVREQFPGAWFVGEVIHGDYVAYVEESGLDSLTQYELWKAIRNSIEERNWFELAWSLQRHDEFAAAFLPLTFLGNHDVTRVASAITDPRHLSHAVAVLFFVAGAPVVYAGDERGLTGTKEDREGGDDAVRPQFPRSPTDWPRTEVYHRYQEVISFRRRHPWLARASVTAAELSNESVLLTATGADGEHATLALNLSDDAVTLGGLPVPAHSWVLTP